VISSRHLCRRSAAFCRRRSICAESCSLRIASFRFFSSSRLCFPISRILFACSFAAASRRRSPSNFAAASCFRCSFSNSSSMRCCSSALQCRFQIWAHPRGVTKPALWAWTPSQGAGLRGRTTSFMVQGTTKIDVLLYDLHVQQPNHLLCSTMPCIPWPC
jgi:hypothetical protein